VAIVLKLAHVGKEFELDLQFVSTKSSEEDFGFTERFVRKLFYDSAYCVERYIRDIRPHRRGRERLAAAGPLDESPIQIADGGLLVDHQQIMQSWEALLMEAMVRGACRSGDSVLEIGFGLGISAAEIQRLKPSRHGLPTTPGVSVISSGPKSSAAHPLPSPISNKP